MKKQLIVKSDTIATDLRDLRNVCHGESAFELIDEAINKGIEDDVFDALCEHAELEIYRNYVIDAEDLNDLLTYDEDIRAMVFPEDTEVQEEEK